MQQKEFLQKVLRTHKDSGTNSGRLSIGMLQVLLLSCPLVKVSLSKTPNIKLLQTDGLNTLHGSRHHWCVCERG